MSESKIQHQILSYARTKGWYARKVIVANRAGTADIFMCVEGLLVIVEVKRNETIEPSELQKYNIRAVKKSGGIAFSAGSLQQFKDRLKTSLKDNCHCTSIQT